MPSKIKGVIFLYTIIQSPPKFLGCRSKVVGKSTLGTCGDAPQILEKFMWDEGHKGPYHRGVSKILKEKKSNNSNSSHVNSLVCNVNAIFKFANDINMIHQSQMLLSYFTLNRLIMHIKVQIYNL